MNRTAALASGARLGWIVGRVLRFRRGLARRQMHESLPGITPKEIEAHLDAMYRNLGMTIVELLRSSRLGLDDLRSNLDVVDPLPPTEPSRGALMFTGHIGNWESLALLGLLMNKHLTGVVKTIRKSAVQEILTSARHHHGVTMVPVKESYKACMKALKAGESVGVILDQNTKRNSGVFVDFFGRQACTSPGLAVLSATAGFPVYMCHTLRQPNGRLKLFCQGPIPPPADRTPEALRATTQIYTRMLEEVIRANPSQWTWIHRRWKTQPKAGQERLADAVATGAST